MPMTPTAEDARLADTAAGRADGQRWGTDVSDRAWGMVREDDSADGQAWEYCPHDHARSRASRWNEDALAQTGWTALVALLLQFGGRLCFETLPFRADAGPANPDAPAIAEHSKDLPGRRPPARKVLS
jgi:hypothetical protein